MTLLIGAGWVWNLYFAAHRLEDIMIYLWLGIVGGFIVGLVTVFHKPIAPYTSPIYALLEGFAIGALSALYEAKRRGIAVQAVGLLLVKGMTRALVTFPSPRRRAPLVPDRSPQ